LKEVVEETCHKILDIDVREEEPVEYKVANFSLAIKGYKDNITDVQFTYEMNTIKLQMKLQPTTPQEV